MTTYTKAALDREARLLVAEARASARKTRGTDYARSVKLGGWSIIIGDGQVTLAVFIHTVGTGTIQRNVAI